MKKIFLALALASLVVGTFAPAPVLAFDQQTEGAITQQLFIIANRCSIPVSISNPQPAICVRAAVAVSLDACVTASNRSIPAIQTCMQAAISETGPGVLDQCMPNLSEAQKSCALGSAAEAVDIDAAAGESIVQSVTGGAATTQSSGGGEFVPLTSLPGIDTVESAANLPAFLNSLYMISVGAAAVLAVLQIVRGGIIYMLSDAGVTEKREAKQHIMMAILGLVLVLSPAIVFGIINPQILNLQINVSGLQPDDLELQADVDPTGQTPCLTGNCDGSVGDSTTGGRDPGTGNQTGGDESGPGQEGEGDNNGSGEGGNDTDPTASEEDECTANGGRMVDGECEITVTPTPTTPPPNNTLGTYDGPYTIPASGGGCYTSANYQRATSGCDLVSVTVYDNADGVQAGVCNATNANRECQQHSGGIVKCITRSQAVTLRNACTAQGRVMVMTSNNSGDGR